jgi:DNA polymerase-3 subunit alpha
MKANYPAEFFAASMNFELGDTDKLNIFRQELARHRIALLPPDINKSYPMFAVEVQENGAAAIRYALAAIKGVGDTAMRAMVKSRDAGGPFKDLFDFSERVETRLINRKQMESLAAAGAFDNLNRNRAQVMAAVDLLLKHSQQSGDERASGQSNMFGAADAAKPPLPAAKAWDDLTRLQHEFQALGFYLSAHPLDNYRAVLDRMGVVAAGGIGTRLRASGPSRFKLAGVILGKQERTAKSGNKFAFVQLSDGGGAFELTVFSELLAARRDLLEAGQAVLIEADAQGDTRQGADGSEIRFIARSIDPLAQAAERAAQGIRIKVFDAPDIAEIQKVLKAAPGSGRGKVTLLLDLDDGEEAEMELPGAWLLNEAVKGSLRQIGGGLEVAEY